MKHLIVFYLDMYGAKSVWTIDFEGSYFCNGREIWVDNGYRFLYAQTITRIVESQDNAIINDYNPNDV